MQLFFVLSGYLITGILLNVRDEIGDGGGQHAALRAFYIRRLLRIFPLYYAVVLGITAAGLSSTRETFWWNIAYASNILFFLKGQWLPNVSHFWSLAVEEQFYLLWPWIVLYCRPARLVPVISALVISGLFLKLFLAVLLPGGNEFVSKLPFGAWDALGGGGLLACFRSSAAMQKRYLRGAFWIGILLWPIFTLMPVGCGVIFRELRLFGIVSLCVWSVGSLVSGAAPGLRRFLTHPVLVAMGSVSYGLYILHPLVPHLWDQMAAVMKLEEACKAIPGLRLMCLAVVLAIVAAGSWHFFEAPLNRLKRYFPYFGSN